MRIEKKIDLKHTLVVPHIKFFRHILAVESNKVEDTNVGQRQKKFLLHYLYSERGETETSEVDILQKGYNR